MSEHTAESDAYDEEGFVLDEYGQPFGYCNACGEESPAYAECCEDGEVVPYECVIPPAEGHGGQA